MSSSSEPNRNNLSRREMFSGLFAPFRKAIEAGTKGVAGQGEKPKPVVPAVPQEELIAVIGGRLCLAYHEIPCTVCIERCPVPGALVSDAGLPRVVPDLCTGCGVCHQVCPAPENAIRMVPCPPGLRKPAAPSAPPPGDAPVERRSSRDR